MSIAPKRKFCGICNSWLNFPASNFHYWSKHTVAGRNHNPNKGYENGTRVGWSKGLTKETNSSVNQMQQELKRRYASGELISPFKGRTHSETAKKKLSDSHKLAIKEGRNKGWTTRKNQPSYPELFWERVFKNNRICFEREVKMGRYWADFVIGKLIVEIDGSQHQSRKEHDKEKDKYLTSKGFRVFRIDWKLFNRQEITDLINTIQISSSEVNGQPVSSPS